MTDAVALSTVIGAASSVLGTVAFCLRERSKRLRAEADSRSLEVQLRLEEAKQGTVLQKDLMDRVKLLEQRAETQGEHLASARSENAELRAEVKQLREDNAELANFNVQLHGRVAQLESERDAARSEAAHAKAQGLEMRRQWRRAQGLPSEPPPGGDPPPLPAGDTRRLRPMRRP